MARPSCKGVGGRRVRASRRGRWPPLIATWALSAAGGRYGLVVYQGRLSAAVQVNVYSFYGWVPGPLGSSSPPAKVPSAPAAPPSSPPPDPDVGSGTAATRPGSLPPGGTAYPVPKNAIFVAPAGDDSAAGSRTQPLRTLAAAVERAQSGSTIVLRGGTYHEAVTVPKSKTVTIQAYPREAVWLDGSTAVTTWTRIANGWVHTGWTTNFDHTAGYTKAIAARRTPDFIWVNPAHPMAAYPDQVWIDNVAQRQVQTLGQLTTGTFYVDTASQRLYVGSSPSGSTVRASDLEVALHLASPNSVLRGVGVRRYGTPITQIATVRVRGAGDVIQNVVLVDNATEGLDLSAPGLRADHLTVQRSGLLGIRVAKGDGLQLTNSVVSDNNTEHFNYSPVAGGIKVTNTNNVYVAHSSIHDNLGNGIWFDTSCYGISVAHNDIYGNDLRGVVTEISDHALIVDNMIGKNTAQGIFVFDTGHVKIWNNTLSGNAHDISLSQDDRDPQTSTTGFDQTSGPDPNVPWITQDVQINNNLLLSVGPLFTLTVADGTGRRGADEMKVAVDGNVFRRQSTAHTGEIAWGYKNKKIVGFRTPEEFSVATGQGQRNRDFLASRTTAAAAATHADPLPLPANIASLAVRPAGSRHVGAF